MRRQSQGAATAWATLTDVMGWVLVASAVLTVLITGYYIYATVAANSQLFRAVAQPGTFMPRAEFVRHMGNMELLTRVLLICTGGLIVSSLIRYWNSTETGLLLLVAGAGFFFGMPFLIANYGGPANGLPRNYLDEFGNPRVYLANQFILAGMPLMAAGAAHLVFSVIRFFINARGRRPLPNAEAAQTAAQVRKPQDRFLGPCWTLPFCRDTDKKLCPIRQSKKPCWQGGRGCYCDQQIILSLSGGNTYAASRGAAGYLSRTAAVIRPKSRQEKRENCLQCPVYLHHQSHKYKLMVPVALVGGLGLLAYYGPTLVAAYPPTMAAIGRSLAGLTFSTTAAGSLPDWVAAHPEWVAKVGDPAGVPDWAANLANTQGIMWMLLAMVSILLVAYLLQGVEWMLYRLGI